jgi:hypothetical protein
MEDKMLYGTMHDSAILTVGKKLGRKGKKHSVRTPAEEAAQAYLLVGMFWSMLTWARYAKALAVAVLVVGFALDGLDGLVVAYVLASPLGGLVFLSRNVKN